MNTATRDYPTGHLRVCDDDRDQALRELTEAFQVGRLTADEFDQRCEQALGARTGQDLTVLLADLPPVPLPPPAQPPGFDWVGTITPAAIAVLLVAVVVVVLCVARSSQSQPCTQGR
jgi:Domain of unknown function (DUF1707)